MKFYIDSSKLTIWVAYDFLCVFSDFQNKFAILTFHTLETELNILM